MSVNYYLDEPHNEAGHLGKKSRGWVFSAYAPAGVDSLAQWIGQTEGHKIVDEYGVAVTLTDFLAEVFDSRTEPHQNPALVARPEFGLVLADFEDSGIVFHRYRFC